MRKDGKLKKIFVFQLYECTAVEEYLEEMALKGWMLDNIKGFLFTFSKIEPKRIKFAVDIFDKASIFDTKPANTTLEYIEYCKEAGWNYVCGGGKVQIFFSDGNPVPIQTDSKYKLKAIHKAVMLQNLLIWFMPLLWAFLFYQQISFSFDYFITSYAWLWMTVFWLSYTLFSFVQILNYGRWYLSSHHRVKHGKDLIYRNIRQVRRFNSFLLSLLFILALIAAINVTYAYAFVDYFYVKGLMIIGFILLFVIAAVITTKYYRCNNHSRETNIVLTCTFGFIFAYIFFIYCLVCVIGGSLWGKPATELVHIGNTFATISHNSVPITMEDFGERQNGFRDSSAHHNETIFASRSNYTDYCYVNNFHKGIGIEYSVFNSSYPWIVKHYLQMIKSRRYAEYRDINSTIWNAEKAYQDDKNNRILVVYEKKIMQFKADIEYSPEQIEFIRKQLNLY